MKIFAKAFAFVSAFLFVSLSLTGCSPVSEDMKNWPISSEYKPLDVDTYQRLWNYPEKFVDQKVGIVANVYATEEYDEYCILKATALAPMGELYQGDGYAEFWWDKNGEACPFDNFIVGEEFAVGAIVADSFEDETFSLTTETVIQFWLGELEYLDPEMR